MKKSSFNNGWEFCLQDVESNSYSFATPHLWQGVNIPHDWSTDYPFEKLNNSAFQGAYAKCGVGWYRKAFFVTEEELDNRTILYFEGIYRRSTIYINGVEIGGRAYGYSSFWYDVKPFLKTGLNLIAVRVDNSAEPSSRWYNGCGITRNVWLYTGNELSIPPHGVQIVCDDIRKNSCDVTVNLSEEYPDGTQITIKIFSPNGDNVAIVENHNKLKILNPAFWDIDTPNIYSCEVCISKDGQSDTATARFGIKTVEFVPHKGMFLNGRNIKIKGVCLHHDAGCLGAAVPKAMWRKRLLMLKEMGCNAVRTAHNPFDICFYELCDELGLLVMDESFDGWDIVKADHDYGEDWADNCKKDLSDLIVRDRNHPSIFMWSIGNEVTQMNPDMTKELMGIIHQLDPTRLVTCGVQGVDEESDKNRAVLDIAGYNDGGGACFVYERDHEKRPEQLFIATEAPHTFQTRGFYRTQTWWRDHNLPRIEIENLTQNEVFFDGDITFCSSYDNCGVRTSVRDSWSLSERFDYLCGEFRWTGFDYLGECGLCEQPSKSYSFGIIDTANFEKDHYYLYQSMWSDKPMVHLLPHWTHPDMPLGTEIPIHVYTNCDEAELFLNDVSLGRKTRGDSKNLEWLVGYRPGELTAKAYNNAQPAAEKSYKTALTPAKLSVDTSKLASDTTLKEAVCTVIDKNGTEVPYADCLTEIYINNCRLLGSDNGNSLDLSDMKSTKRRAFNGKCLYILGDICADSEIYVAGLLGKRYFAEKTELCVYTTLSGDYRITYTLDGSEPTKNSAVYEKPIEIDATSLVKIKIYVDEVKMFYLSDTFIKGAPEPVIDIAHLNYLPDTDTPPGPFAKEICGEWGSDGFSYSFERSGVLNRMLGSDKQQIGHWWYDYPSDAFEAKDYAGTGEVWFLTGERCHLSLTAQKGGDLVMDNSKGAIKSLVVENNKMLVFKRYRQL